MHPPQPLRVRLEGQPNFRDLGGYATGCKRVVAHGRIYRSGALAALTDADVRELERLDIRTVIDLRTPGEIDKDGADRVPDRTRIVNLPIDTMSIFVPALAGDFQNNGLEAYQQTYSALVDRFTYRFAELVDRVEEAAAQPLVFHCSHGKDRAGIAAVVLLAALGVDWATIEHDYLYSNVCRRDHTEAAIAKAGGDDDKEWLRRLYQVEPEYLAASRRRIEELHGTLESYLATGLRLSPDRLQRLRRALLVEPCAELDTTRPR